VDRSNSVTEALRAKYRTEFLAGAEAACCEYQGYPDGFHAWALERRNAWWAGFNEGYTLLHSDVGTIREPSAAEKDRKAWRGYRKWEEKEIKEGRLKPNELTGRADALTAPRSKFEAQLKDAKNGRAPRTNKT
jgi:hypothetical protein